VIALGFYRQEFSALGIAGFFFLFILSFVFMQGNIQYKTGSNETNIYACLCCDQGYVIGVPYYEGSNNGCTNESATLSIIKIIKLDNYETWDAGGVTTHWVGYILAVMSVIGLIGIFVSIGSERFGKS
jgi:hypothetical protein